MKLLFVLLSFIPLFALANSENPSRPTQERETKQALQALKEESIKRTERILGAIANRPNRAPEQNIKSLILALQMLDQRVGIKSQFLDRVAGDFDEIQRRNQIIETTPDRLDSEELLKRLQNSEGPVFLAIGDGKNKPSMNIDLSQLAEMAQQPLVEERIREYEARSALHSQEIKRYFEGGTRFETIYDKKGNPHVVEVEYRPGRGHIYTPSQLKLMFNPTQIAGRTLAHFPAEAARFYAAVFQVSVDNMIFNMAHNPLAVHQFWEMMQDPIGHVGFLSFVMAAGLTQQYLATKWGGDFARAFLPYMGMAVGGIASEITHELLMIAQKCVAKMKINAQKRLEHDMARYEELVNEKNQACDEAYTEFLSKDTAVRMTSMTAALVGSGLVLGGVTRGIQEGFEQYLKLHKTRVGGQLTAAGRMKMRIIGTYFEMDQAFDPKSKLLHQIKDYGPKFKKGLATRMAFRGAFVLFAIERLYVFLKIDEKFFRNQAHYMGEKFMNSGQELEALNIKMNNYLNNFHVENVSEDEGEPTNYKGGFQYQQKRAQEGWFFSDSSDEYYTRLRNNFTTYQERMAGHAPDDLLDIASQGYQVYGRPEAMRWLDGFADFLARNLLDTSIYADAKNFTLDLQKYHLKAKEWREAQLHSFHQGYHSWQEQVSDVSVKVDMTFSFYKEFVQSLNDYRSSWLKYDDSLFDYNQYDRKNRLAHEYYIDEIPLLDFDPEDYVSYEMLLKEDSTEKTAEEPSWWDKVLSYLDTMNDSAAELFGVQVENAEVSINDSLKSRRFKTAFSLLAVADVIEEEFLKNEYFQNDLKRDIPQDAKVFVDRFLTSLDRASQYFRSANSRLYILKEDKTVYESAVIDMAKGIKIINNIKEDIEESKKLFGDWTYRKPIYVRGDSFNDQTFYFHRYIESFDILYTNILGSARSFVAGEAFLGYINRKFANIYKGYDVLFKDADPAESLIQSLVCGPSVYGHSEDVFDIRFGTESEQNVFVRAFTEAKKDVFHPPKLLYRLSSEDERRKEKLCQSGPYSANMNQLLYNNETEPGLLEFAVRLFPEDLLSRHDYAFENWWADHFAQKFLQPHGERYHMLYRQLLQDRFFPKLSNGHCLDSKCLINGYFIPKLNSRDPRESLNAPIYLDHSYLQEAQLYMRFLRMIIESYRGPFNHQTNALLDDFENRFSQRILDLFQELKKVDSDIRPIMADLFAYYSSYADLFSTYQVEDFKQMTWSLEPIENPAYKRLEYEEKLFDERVKNSREEESSLYSMFEESYAKISFSREEVANALDIPENHPLLADSGWQNFAALIGGVINIDPYRAMVHDERYATLSIVLANFNSLLEDAYKLSSHIQLTSNVNKYRQIKKTVQEGEEQIMTYNRSDTVQEKRSSPTGR